MGNCRKGKEMGAKCGRNLVVFTFFCNIEPFSAKIMFPEYIFAIINVNAKKCAYRFSQWLNCFYKFDKISKLIFAGNVACAHSCIKRRRVYDGQIQRIDKYFLGCPRKIEGLPYCIYLSGGICVPGWFIEQGGRAESVNDS